MANGYVKFPVDPPIYEEWVAALIRSGSRCILNWTGSYTYWHAPERPLERGEDILAAAESVALNLGKYIAHPTRELEPAAQHVIHDATGRPVVRRCVRFVDCRLIKAVSRVATDSRGIALLDITRHDASRLDPLLIPFANQLIRGEFD
jgi:hypothetical protein